MKKLAIITLSLFIGKNVMGMNPYEGTTKKVKQFFGKEYRVFTGQLNNGQCPTRVKQGAIYGGAGYSGYKGFNLYRAGTKNITMSRGIFARNCLGICFGLGASFYAKFML